MNISYFGLGYVGCVGAVCCASMGHHVIGYDISPEKVALINRGMPTIIEEKIEELTRGQWEAGRLTATEDPEQAVLGTDITFIVVGTPTTGHGHLNLDYICQAAKKIGDALRKKKSFHIVVIRSTVLPGTNRNVTEIIEKVSGKTANRDFAVVSNPEFLREGSAVRDFMNPPLTLVGTKSSRAADVLRELYRPMDAEFISTDIEVAEMMKYVNNTYHALKVVFGNEVGNICKKLNIDSAKVMDIFCRDTQLNISPYYFRPGFAYGGSCLPKDLRAFTTLAHDLYVDAPVISSIHASNEIQKAGALRIIESKGKKKIGIMGLAFKSGTDDLRYSPIMEIVQSLLGKGYLVRIYDRNVFRAWKTGVGAELLKKKYGYLLDLITDDREEVLAFGDVIVIANREEEFRDIPEHCPGRILVDLVRQYDRLDYEGNYEGLSWGNINVNRKQNEKIQRDIEKTDF
ncbi:UDP-glucose dehydrogenase family protein [Lachnoclostridium sp. Marseille-P6806]|uniref:UDP-glucose dehydrogenase family protein n=1 Tax=Lachnoclostridium sp. Marseille-P6806 TaxID=2364793 RepID=UPI00102FBBD8|nr:UDP-glucose/GDP-mannose dehydrogenase family protein [Lachnoclostridium sp. Marseille-P6806]